MSKGWDKIGFSLVILALAAYLIFAIRYALMLPVDADPGEAQHVRTLESSASMGRSR